MTRWINTCTRQGLDIRSAVLGEAHVNAAAANADEFSQPLQDLVTEYCWARWGRDGLALKTRSMLNLAMLSILNRPQELRTVRGALNNGVTREEIQEVLLQVAIYAGVPAAVASFRISPARPSPNSTPTNRSFCMQVGFIGLGHMGFPMAHRLLGAGHEVVAFDTRREVLDELVARGAQEATTPKVVGDRVETILASLPSLQASLAVATGVDGVIEGSRVRRFVDLSTIGSQMAQQINARLATRGIALVDAAVSGGVGGAEKGDLAVMVSGPSAHVEAVLPVLTCLGRPFQLGERIGTAQTMKLINNLLSATALAATGEALVIGVKAGLDAETMLAVINAGSGANTASKDKFPRAVIPRTFDYGFATGLMVKDLRLCLDEVRALGLTMAITETVARVWESTIDHLGPDCDFTSVVRPIEDAAGVTIGARRDQPT